MALLAAGLIVLPSTGAADFAPGLWSATANMEAPRSGHTATVLDGPACRAASATTLPDYCGKVLVVGLKASESDPPAELYNPRTGGTWERAAQRGPFASLVPRRYHSATLLDGPECHRDAPPAHCGKVLVAGGQALGMGSQGNFLASAQLYDPAVNEPAQNGGPGSWSDAAPLTTRRRQHTATLLDAPACRPPPPATTPAHCGKVLVAGGQGPPADVGSGALNSVTLFDPAAAGGVGAWSPAAPMNVARYQHSAALLDGPACHRGNAPSYCGRVLVAGNESTGSGRGVPEVFDPSSPPGSWSLTSQVTSGNSRLTALESGNLRLTALEGPACEVATPPSYCDDVLAAGALAARYDPATGSWSATGAPTAFHGSFGYTATLLDGPQCAAAPPPAYCGRVLLAGGDSDGDTAEIHVPDQGEGVWVPTGSLAFARGEHTATLLDRYCGSHCGKVLVAGGEVSAPGNSRSAELFDPAARVASADVSVTVEGPAGPVAVGQDLVYQITARNAAGGDKAAAVTVTDVLPAGVAFKSSPGGSGCSADAGGRVVTCLFGSLAPGAVGTKSVIVTAETPGVVGNTVHVTTPTPDPDRSNNTATDATTVSGAPGTADLGLAITDSPDPVGVNGAVTYTLSVTNAGPDGANGVVVTNDLPPGVTHSSSSGCTLLERRVNCSLGSLAAGATASATVTVATTEPGPFANAATVTSATGDPNNANNADTESTNVAGPPSVTGVTPGSLAQGSVNQTLSIAGSGFVAGAQPSFSGTGITVNSTTFVDQGTLRADVSVAAGAPTGTRNVTVTNPGGGAGTCADCFSVTASGTPTVTTQPTSSPGPTVSGATPSSLPQGSANRSITVSGTAFASGASVSFSGDGITVHSTAFVSATTVRATVSLSDGATLGPRDVRVHNPGGSSATCVQCFTVVETPTPVVTGAAPNALERGAASQQVTVSGTDFVSGAAVSFSGDGVTVHGTTYVDQTRVRATLSIAAGATPGARDVTVTNPGAKAGTCSGCFTVTAPSGPPPPAPAVSAASPATQAQGQANAPVAVTGSGFAAGAVPSFSGVGVTVHSTTFAGATRLEAVVSVAAGAATGARDIVVTNPDGQTGTCPGCFAVTAAPAPRVTAVTPASLPRGALRQELTLAGSDFAVGATPSISGEGVTVHAITFVDATTVRVTVSVGNAAPVGARDVTLTNPSGRSGTCAGCFSVTATGGSQSGSAGGQALPAAGASERNGYRLGAADGGIFAFGDASFHGSTGAIRLAQPIVGMASTRSGNGYWLVASDGGIFAFGDAVFRGSTGALRLSQPIVGMASTPSGNGYWLVARDGGVFAFGDAAFRGSTGAIRLSQPVVGMASTPTGNGYWLVAADGGIFAFGDAVFRGSTGAIRLAQPIVGMAPTPSGNGYWLVASDGGVFAFGDAAFRGSTGAMRLAQPIVGMSASGSGGGYWLVARDGGIFAFGDAAFRGSTGALRLAQPIVGMGR